MSSAQAPLAAQGSNDTSMDWVPLPPPINPLVAVRRTTSEVMARAKHVSVNVGAVEQLAKMWAMDGGQGGASVGWNESGWHYSEDAAAGGNLTCQYVFVLGKCQPSTITGHPTMLLCNSGKFKTLLITIRYGRPPYCTNKLTRQGRKTAKYTNTLASVVALRTSS